MKLNAENKRYQNATLFKKAYTVNFLFDTFTLVMHWHCHCFCVEGQVLNRCIAFKKKIYEMYVAVRM